MEVNVRRHKLMKMASMLRYEFEELPFTYLRVKIGASQKRIAMWSGLVEKVKKNLKAWEDKRISFGGRITLLNRLYRLYLYQISFYILPSKIIKTLTSLQCNFL